MNRQVTKKIFQQFYKSVKKVLMIVCLTNGNILSFEIYKRDDSIFDSEFLKH